jgi:hypothetical protein
MKISQSEKGQRDWDFFVQRGDILFRIIMIIFLLNFFFELQLQV